jgi:hypothetical protein
MGLKKCLIHLQKELISWFGNVERMERTRLPERELELKFKGARPLR